MIRLSSTIQTANGVVDGLRNIHRNETGWLKIQSRSLVSYAVRYTRKYVTEKQPSRNGKKTTRRDHTKALRRIVLFFCSSFFGRRWEKATKKKLKYPCQNRPATKEPIVRGLRAVFSCLSNQPLCRIRHFISLDLCTCSFIWHCTRLSRLKKKWAER